MKPTKPDTSLGRPIAFTEYVAAQRKCIECGTLVKMPKDGGILDPPWPYCPQCKAFRATAIVESTTPEVESGHDSTKQPRAR